MATPRYRSEAEDSDLVAALKIGDETAFRQLVEQQGPRMLSVARRFMRDDDQARDVVQEAFIQVYRKIGTFKQKAKLSTWLHRIVVNTALMRIRSRKRKREDSIEDMLPGFLEDGHQANPARPWSDSGEKLLQRKEVRQLVRDAIDRLPDNYRTVLLMRDIEEMSTAETAQALEITENAVKIRLHRARQALREQIDPALRKEAL
ncbi:MAG TPA: sigma-70 family RNA polymerase sigma factor [Acidobacteriota bacterium]|nr:sigma-70 family RNA polymerase sigma factor [Acidobacteriota bacterium]